MSRRNNRARGSFLYPTGLPVRRPSTDVYDDVTELGGWGQRPHAELQQLEEQGDRQGARRYQIPRHRSHAKQVLQLQYPSHQIFMRVPARVRFCVQRKVRRGVLFAKNRAGYSGSVKKRWVRRTQSSYYRC